MRRIILLIITSILIGGCASKYDERLIGSWRSDREKTLAEFYRRFPSRFEKDPDKKEKFAEIFGHMTHSYTATEFTAKYKKDVFTVKYKVLEKSDKDVIVKFSCSECMEKKLNIRFEDDLQSYWVNENSQFPENFKKIQ